MEILVKFHGQQNVSGASSQKSVAAFSQTTKVDLFFNMKIIEKNQT